MGEFFLSYVKAKAPGIPYLESRELLKSHLKFKHFRCMRERGNGCGRILKVEYLGISIILRIHTP